MSIGIVVIVSFLVSVLSSLITIKYVTETLTASWLHISSDSYRKAQKKYEATVKEIRE